jgi:apolipoprotein N-acyltransferase
VAVSGAGFVLAFPAPDLGFLGWIALVPLLLATRHHRPRAAFWLGSLWGIVAYGGVFWWITTFGVAAWALLTLLGAVFPGLAMLAIAWVERDHEGPWAFLWIALVWTAVEFLRSQGPLGFPWALLGASQHRAAPVLQIASLTGIYGVSFLVALVNATFYVVLTRRAVIVPACGTGVVLVGALLWGAVVLRYPVPATLVVAAVQPNFAVRAGQGPEFNARALADLGRLTHEAASRGATLVVWPETASPIDIASPPVLAAIRSWALGDRVSVIATSLEGGRTNSAFAFAPSGLLVGRYDKVRLVPFAEAGEEAGRAPAVLRTPQAHLGMAICYESVFPGIARQAVRDGATLLAVITNDAWFDGRAAPAQHAALAPFRAVEEGRYLIRAANQGFSAIIDPRGRTLDELPLGRRGILTARVAPIRGLTVYARIGDAFGWAVTLVSVVLLLPRGLVLIAEEAGRPPFARLIIRSAFPLLAIGGVAWAQGSGAASPGPLGMPLPLVAVLCVTGFMSLGHPLRELGFGIRGFGPALALGLAGVGGLALIARQGFASHGAPPDLGPSGGGGWAGTVVPALVAGLTLEWWLRGLVFADAAAWRGWGVAVVWSALLGTFAASWRGPEAMVWALYLGVVLGLVRARWPQVPALAVAHAAGNVLLGFLISLW